MKGSNRLNLALAVDIGGSKIAVALVDRHGRVHHRQQEPTACEGGQAVVEQIVRLAVALRTITSREISALGVAVPGALDPLSGFVHWAPNLPGWRDLPLGALLHDALDLPVFVGYDGHMAVLGEWWCGAGRGARNVVCLVIGTGIGGGIILDGRLYQGRNNIAGAAGWMVVQRELDCGGPGRSLGNLESLAAGPAVVAAVERALAAGTPSTLAGKRVTAPDVFAAAEAGDALAQRVVGEAAQALGVAAAGIVSLLNPDVLILGGGIGSSVSAYLTAVREAIDHWAQPLSARSVRVVQATLGNDANLVGVARMVFQGLRSGGVQGA